MENTALGRPSTVILCCVKSAAQYVPPPTFSRAVCSPVICAIVWPCRLAALPASCAVRFEMSPIPSATVPLWPLTEDTGPLARTLSATPAAAAASYAALCARASVLDTEAAVSMTEPAIPALAEITQSTCSAAPI